MKLLLFKILDSLEGFWGSVKGGASKAWDTTKDVSKSAYCSVKSVFFDSDCDDSKRRRRSVGILPKPSRPDCGRETVVDLVSEGKFIHVFTTALQAVI